MQSSSREKLEVIIGNPWLVKAGIPLILSATAFIAAKILSNRASPVSQEEEELQAGSPSVEIETDLVEILEELKRREYELEKRFLIYQDMKERESTDMDIRNKLCMEMKRLEFLAREASLMEAEAKRMENLMVEYLRVVKKLATSGWEKGLLQKKARKLRKRVGEKSKVVKEQSFCIKARDEEMMRSQRELERKSEVIVELENEVRLIKGVADQLNEEKIEILGKLEMVERSALAKPKIEEVVTKEQYDKVVEEVEHKEKDPTEMENELIHLRWSNACLRHELKRCQEQLESAEEDTNGKSNLELESSPREARKLQELFNDVECDGSGSPLVCDIDKEGSCLTQNGRVSRRKRLARKLRKWVEGGGKIDENQKHEEMIKCFGRHSVAHSEEAYDNFVHPRNSFSSV